MYFALKYVHVCTAILTISGFTLRGIWMLSGSPLLNHKLTRILPHVVDSAFLVSGIALTWVLKLPLLDQPWLLAKLVAIVVYILLGMAALRRGRSRRSRVIAFVLALATFAYIAGVAWNKSPASWLPMLIA